MKQFYSTMHFFALILIIGLFAFSSSSAQFGRIKTPDIKPEKILKTDEKKDEIQQKSQEKTNQAVATPKTGGGLMFFNRPIDPNNLGSPTTKFKAGDYIYAYFAIDKTFRSMIESHHKSGDFSIEFKHESTYAITTTGTLRGDALDQNYLILEIIPDPQFMQAYSNPNIEYKRYPNPMASSGPIRFAYEFAELDPGTYNYSFVVKFNFNNEVAKGNFTISGNDYSVYKNIMNKLNQTAQDAATAGAKMSPAKMNNPNLEKELIDAFKKSNYYKNNIKGSVQKLVIIDPEWYIVRHDISGAIIDRYLRAEIAIKDEKGDCWVYKQVTFRQDYVGGKYKTSRFDGAGDKFKIPCGNL